MNIDSPVMSAYRSESERIKVITSCTLRLVHIKSTLSRRLWSGLGWCGTMGSDERIQWTLLYIYEKINPLTQLLS
jgi:hypothetical protein